ncbi:Mbov_0397 family ICE element conjugal transfer ATPase [Mycoplasma procyoni]|uniref:Mbov_0397 family ICE element conjugal transfer ATPase n=1 Tax=Mycoplasma procyoni TaxID=568784 RepID=UPI00197B6A21|nr:DUF87 domain-containing protein [Mycoplasma procyoni]MBN3534787.1 DUF87 domain-containing protein [Mycoplasma procyoni]
MLQPKKITKNKTVIAKNFYLSDLIVSFSLVILSFFVGWFSIPQIKYKNIISISLILVLISLFSAFLIYIPNQNARVWLLFWRWFLYWIDNKKFSEKVNKTESIFNYKTINENGFIELKKALNNNYKYLGFIEFEGQNIWNKNSQQKKTFLSQFSKFLNVLEFDVCFVKLKVKADYTEFQKDLKSKIKNSKQHPKIKQYWLKNKEIIDSIETKEYKDKYYICVYSQNTKELENNINFIVSHFEKMAIISKKMDKKDVKEFLNLFYEKNENTENKDILELIPSKIETKSSHLRIDNVNYRISTISDYSIDLNVGWANSFFDTSNTKIVWKISPINFETYEKIINSATNKLLTSMAFNNKSIFRKKKDQKYVDAIDETINLINTENQKLFNSSLFFITKLEDSKEHNKQLLKENNLKIKYEKCSQNNLTFRQFEAYKSLNFCNDDTLKEGIEMISRNIAFGWPFIYENYSLDANSYVGKNQKQNFFLNIWKRNFYHTNSNCVFLGTSGAGKTTAMKKLILDNYLKNNCDVVILDPQSEYSDIGNIFDINIIKAGSPENSINPFWIENFKAIESLENKEIKERISFLISWFKLMISNWSEEKEIIITNALISLYKSKINEIKKGNFPVVSDFIKEVENQNWEDVEKEIYQKEQIKLLAWLKSNFENGGIYQKYYNSKQNLNLNSNFIVIDTKVLIENSSKTEINVFFYLILFNLRSKLNQNAFVNKNKTLILIDELHKFIDENNLQTLNFVFDSAKTIRKYNGSLMLATQNISDFSLNKKLENKTNAILKNMQYKFFFNLPGQDIKLTNLLFNPSSENDKYQNLINDIDADFITNSTRGECLLISSIKHKYYFKFDYNKFEKHFFFKEKHDRH